MASDIPSIIARADQIGAQKSTLANQATNQAIALANSIVVPVPNETSVTYQPPAIPGIIDPTPQVIAAYDSARNSLRAEMVNQFSTFFSQFFPIGNELTAAMGWVSNAISVGGSGINIGVENAIWERSRSRLLRDTVRAEDEVMTTWAARRYTLPPGAAAHQLAQVRTTTMNSVADASRDAAIEAFKAELENIRLAVTTAVQARSAAMSAASDYIRALALGPQTGINFSGQVADTKMRAQQLLTDLYSANVTGEKTRVDSEINVSKLNLDAKELTLKGNVDRATLAVQAAMAAAQSAGTQAAAALNAIHAQVGWNLNDSRDLSGTF